jgi:hypothetical protein
MERQFKKTLDYKKFEANIPKNQVGFYDPSRERYHIKGTKWYHFASIPRSQMFAGLRLDQIVLCKSGRAAEYFWVLVCKRFKAKIRFHDVNGSFVFTIRLGENKPNRRRFINLGDPKSRSPKMVNF